MAVEGENTDTGEGGEGGAGGGAGGAFDEKRLANLANAAVSGHLKRALPKAIAEALAPFMEQLGARGAPAPAGGAPAGGAPAPAGDDKYAALERKFQESEKARVAERVAGYQHRAFDTVRGELSGKVRADALDSALKILKADGCIQVREDGTPFFAMNDQELSITEGVKLFLKTKEGALFLPAPTPVKPGQKGGGKFTPRTGGQESVEPIADKASRLIDKHRSPRD